MSRLELVLPTLAALLIAAGFWALASASPGDLGRQAFALLVALSLCGALGWFGVARLVAWRWRLYLGALLLLAAVQLFGTEVNGARSWLYLKPLPGFQPSELAKVALVLVLAKTLAKRDLRTPLDYLGPLLLLGLPVGLVLWEPDLGSALVMAAVGLGMFLMRGVPRSHLLVLLLAVGAPLPGVVWPNLEPHQRARLVAFVQPDAEPLGSGYQVIQARIAVGAGGLWGQGHGAGTQTQNGFIPYPATDFIFPVLAEEGGFVGAVALLLAYGGLFVCLALMAGRAPDPGDQLIIVGTLLLLGVQMLVNIGMTLGLAPVTGITLPLVSYGGTSLVATLAALTIALLTYRGRYG